MAHHSNAKRYDPVADPKAIVTSGNARITILTPSLIRLEYSPTATFEDRATFAFINRRLPVPSFSVTRHDGKLVITTEHLKLTYTEGTGAFNANNLMVRLAVGGKETTWTPGTPDTGNLRGTIRTLDGVDGRCKLEPGLLSRDGWVVVDDSARLLFDNSDWPWALPRDAAKSGATDWYFFGHARNYAQALKEFTLVAGKIPLCPKYTLGAWWSRYWAYSDQELKDLVADFEKHDVPLDVLVIDMDWHLDGWTGYTWNPRYFPDPEGFLAWCRSKNLKTTLNLHPADGVGKHESQFRAMAQEMKVNTREVYRVPFDCTDRQFVEAYFKILHHPIERQGVDFWWMDWQQGSNTAIEGLDPLYWLNYLHWSDMERDPEHRGVGGRENHRPLIFSRWGGLGNHRYQIGFSGDTYNTWESLAWQPEFTAVASNVGYAYWSHDIGGHQPGPVAPDLYARWIQYGIFSPILRTHAGKRPDAERRIWAFPEDVFNITRDCFHLRYALVPYTYTANRVAYDTGISLCRPLYYQWPELDAAYTHPGQYMYGDDLLAAPVSRPGDSLTGCAEMDVWLPPGTWTDWFTGRTVHAGASGASIRLHVPLDEFPLFAREGAVIPMAPKMRRTTERPLDHMILHVFPGAVGSTRLYEDDGITSHYHENQCAWTTIEHKLAAGAHTIHVGPAQGRFTGQVSQRSYELHVRDTWPAASVLINNEPLEPISPEIAASSNAPGWWYDARTLSVVIRTRKLPINAATEIVVTPTSGLADTTLRHALRGQLKLIDDLNAILGSHAPALLRTASTIRSIAAKDAPAADAAAVKFQADWWSLLSAINTCGAAPAARSKALARLLGFSSRLTLEPGEAGTIAVAADIAFAPRFASSGKVDAAIAFSASDAWQVTLQAGRAADTLGVGDHTRAIARLAPVGVPQYGSVRVSTTVTADGTSFILTSEETLYPSINAWWVIGPFDCHHRHEMKPTFGPEKSLDTSATYEGFNNKPVAWKKVERITGVGPGADPRAEFFVDLHKVFGKHTDHAVAYALTYLHAPRDMDAILAVGSDDGCVVFFNGQELFRKHTQRAYTTKEEKIPVKLKKGPNSVLIKIGQAEGGWGFGAHILDTHGNPLNEIRVSLTP